MHKKQSKKQQEKNQTQIKQTYNFTSENAIQQTFLRVSDMQGMGLGKV